MMRLEELPEEMQSVVFSGLVREKRSRPFIITLDLLQSLGLVLTETKVVAASAPVATATPAGPFETGKRSWKLDASSVAASFKVSYRLADSTQLCGVVHNMRTEEDREQYWLSLRDLTFKAKRKESRNAFQTFFRRSNVLFRFSFVLVLFVSSLSSFGRCLKSD